MAYLGDGEAGNGEAGDGVGAEEAEAVVGAPVEDGEEVLQREHELPGQGLVLELVQGVVGEEDLRQPLPQRARRGPALRRRHLVQLRHHARAPLVRWRWRRRRPGGPVLRRLHVVRQGVHLVVDDHGYVRAS